MIAIALMVGCGSNHTPSSNAPSANASCSGAPRADALAFPALPIDSNQHPFAHEVFFAPGSSEPLGSSMETLDQIAGSMKAIPSVSLLAVMGHTEKTERPEIANSRAVRVIDLLVARGVESARLEARPFVPPAAVVEARCGNTSRAEIEAEHERALAAERAVRFAIVRVDEK